MGYETSDGMLGESSLFERKLVARSGCGQALTSTKDGIYDLIVRGRLGQLVVSQEES